MTALVPAVYGASPVNPEIRIADVKVGERARKDYGDLERLKASIVEHGLLQPIVVLPDDYLLCGGRRLEVCKQLGWVSIPVVRSTTRTDAISRLMAERDENTCRKDMTPSELVAVGLKLEELKRPEAQERQGTRTDLTSWPIGQEVSSPGTRREVADALGMNEAAYKRAKRVVEVADDDTADETVRVAAVAARAEMDAGSITISAAEKRVRDAQEAAVAEPKRRPQAERLDQIRALAATGRTSAQIGAEIGLGEAATRDLARKGGITITADKVMAGTRRVRVDANHTVNHLVMTLEVVTDGLDRLDLDTLDDTQTQYWADSLTATTKSLNKFVNRMKEKAQ